MSDEIMKKLTEHDDQLDTIAQTVAEHTNVLQQHTDILKQHTDTLQQHTERFDRIDKILVDHSEQLSEIKETMATKQDLSIISNTLDELVGLARKKDQELTFMSDRVSRIEEDVNVLKNR